MDRREEIISLAGQVINGMMSSDSNYLFKSIDRLAPKQIAKTAVKIAVEIVDEVDKYLEEKPTIG